ncbi:MAG: DEAD/DEAH box helicase, partial [Candidatus Hodarchaeales archaeon]
MIDNLSLSERGRVKLKQCVIGFKENDLFIKGPVVPFLADLEHIEDTKLGISRFKPSDYPVIKTRLLEQGWEVIEKFNIDYDLCVEDQDAALFSNLQLYTHQKKAYESWRKAGYRGVVILPTGSGKSYIAFEAISELMVKTLIVVPTIFLLSQWREKLMFFDIDEELIGVFGGGKKEVKPITVITYDSASIYTKRLRDFFGLLVFDEVHHLATARTYQDFAKSCISPYRLGLTATLNEGEDVEEFSGPVVIKLLPSELRKTGIITDYSIKTIEVELDQADRKR